MSTEGEKEVVWVAFIEHRHGSDFWVNRSEEGSIDALYEYVNQWWDGEGLEGDITAFDKRAAIEAYFEHVGHEFYSRSAVTVQP